MAHSNKRCKLSFQLQTLFIYFIARRMQILSHLLLTDSKSFLLFFFQRDEGKVQSKVKLPSLKKGSLKKFYQIIPIN